MAKRSIDMKKKGGIAAAVIMFVLFGGIKSAFSMTRVADEDPLDSTFSISSFEGYFSESDELTIRQLSVLEFVESESEDDPEERLDDAAALPADAPAPQASRPADNFRTHIVKKGESLAALARRFGVSAETIRNVNGGSSRLQPGKTLRIPSRDGIMVKLQSGVTIWDLARRYRVRMSDILSFNSIEDGESIKTGTMIFVPGAKAPAPRAAAAGSGFLSWPVSGGRLSSRFGFRRHPITGKIRFHRGLDIAAGYGTPIRSVKAGVVSFSGRRGGYGNMVEVRHADGMITRYAHNMSNSVKAGERVKAGEMVAKVGSTGHSTGPHVHFEVIASGKRKDPIRYLARR